MKFSLITITLNAEKTVRETLQSVAIQQFSSFEHIVFDGGSTDNTEKIVQEFPHVRWIRGKDSGIADAMNQGASYAKGEFLLHLHADDFLLHPHVLQQANTFLLQHPKAKWFSGICGTLDSKGVEIPLFTPYSTKKLRRYNFLSHPAVFYSRALFESCGGFDRGLKYAMDYDLWLRFAQQTALYFLPTPIAIFRKHDKSLSTAFPKEVAHEAFLVRNRYLKSPWERFRSYRTYRERLKHV